MNPSQPTLTPGLIKKISVALILGAALIGLLSYALTHSRLSVTATGGSSADVTLKITGEKQPRVKIVKLKTGSTRTLWLPTGYYTVMAEQDHRATLASSNISIFKQTKLSLSLRDEVASTRLAGQSQGCGLIAGGAYFSYSCTSRTDIYKPAATPTEIASPLPNRTYNTVTPMGGGIIGTAVSGDNYFSIHYLDPATNLQTDIAVPDDIQGGSVYDFFVVPNQQSKGTYQFALVAPDSNTWFLYRNPSDRTPTKIEAGQPTNDLRIFSSQLTGDNLVTYMGPKPASEGQESQSDANDKKGVIKGQLSVFSTGTKAQTFKATLPTAKEYERVRLLSDSTAVAEVLNDGVEFFDLAANSMKSTGIIDEAKNLTLMTDRAMFSRTGSVYELIAATGNAVRLFEASSFNISSLGISGNTVVMQAFTGQKSQQASGVPSAFALDLTKPAIYPRTEWSLSDTAEGGTVGQSATFTGTEALISRAVSTFQVEAFKYSASQYYQSTGKQLTEAAIKTDTIVKQPHDRYSSNIRDAVSFELKLNGETFQAKLEYFNVSSIHLVLTGKPGGAVVYDSKDVDLTQ